MNTVLDIGANVGQFAFTAKLFFPHLKIYSFEPNSQVFLKLKKNASSFKDWQTYKYALGERNMTKAFYYPEGATLGGSFFKEIAGEFLKDYKIKKISVPVIKLDMKMARKLVIPLKVDLVKIDVEGAELEVLESLKRIDFKYLIIEIPVTSKRDASLEKISAVIKNKFKKKARLLHVYSVGNKAYVANAIYRLS
jgi:FkbM family methyltransferase